MKIKVGNCIDFANTILKKEIKIKGKSKVHYSLRTYNKKGSYDILRDIRENVTLLRLMGSFGNVNHAISVVGN